MPNNDDDDGGACFTCMQLFCCIQRDTKMSQEITKSAHHYWNLPEEH